MAKKEENQIDTKAFTEECNTILMAVSDALYVIGGKWKLMIIIAMARGNKRFTEIQRQVKEFPQEYSPMNLKNWN
jgi:DNA-binding HxlR family transcriptional regulator